MKEIPPNLKTKPLHQIFHWLKILPDNPIVDAAEDEGWPGWGHERPWVHPGVPQVSEDVVIETGVSANVHHLETTISALQENWRQFSDLYLLFYQQKYNVSDITMSACHPAHQKRDEWMQKFQTKVSKLVISDFKHNISIVTLLPWCLWICIMLWDINTCSSEKNIPSIQSSTNCEYNQ